MSDLHFDPSPTPLDQRPGSVMFWMASPPTGGNGNGSVLIIRSSQPRILVLLPPWIIVISASSSARRICPGKVLRFLGGPTEKQWAWQICKERVMIRWICVMRLYMHNTPSIVLYTCTFWAGNSTAPWDEAWCTAQYRIPLWVSSARADSGDAQLTPGWMWGGRITHSH